MSSYFNSKFGALFAVVGLIITLVTTLYNYLAGNFYYKNVGSWFGSLLVNLVVAFVVGGLLFKPASSIINSVN